MQHVSWTRTYNAKIGSTAMRARLRKRRQFLVVNANEIGEGARPSVRKPHPLLKTFILTHVKPRRFSGKAKLQQTRADAVPNGFAGVRIILLGLRKAETHGLGNS